MHCRSAALGPVRDLADGVAAAVRDGEARVGLDGFERLILQDAELTQALDDDGRPRPAVLAVLYLEG